MSELDAAGVIARVEVLRRRNADRDRRHREILAIRRGDYESVSPGVFPEEFDRAMVSNLIDTAARDISEVMAPLPSIQCASLSATNKTATNFAIKRGQIAKGYVERSRLADQMFAGCDRYASFGFMAYVVEPSFEDDSPLIRVDDTSSVYYQLDGRGRTKTYAATYLLGVDEICELFPESADTLKNQLIYKQRDPSNQDVTLIAWYDQWCRKLIVEDTGLELSSVANPIDECPVRLVERPKPDGHTHGQFDDVIWVQIARALTQFYTMSALEQSVNAPLVLPDDVNEITLGPLDAITTNNPAGIGRVPLNIPQGVFPEAQILQQEQMVGSRYPQGRSGNIDASVVTGQGVQALMGTFDTQIQTFQRLNASALEDVIAWCFEMDEKLWPSKSKSIRINDNGSPVEVNYVPSKDINNDHTSHVSYGAIAGLDPNRGLIFVLQGLSAGLFSKDTARRNMPIDLNPVDEERKITIEGIEGSLAASLAALPQAIPMMASQGQDPRQIVTDVVQVLSLVRAGRSIEEAAMKVFAPKEDPAAAPDQAPQDPLAALMGGGGAPTDAGPSAGGPASPGQSLLMTLAGMSRNGDTANLQANVSRRQPIGA